MTPTKRQPKAYSYQRWSTKEQTEGDSERRQTMAAERYVEMRGLQLDTSLRMSDKGVSAYHAKNLKGSTSALAGFVKAVDDGIVPSGSFLLVEDLDRFSRWEPIEAAWSLKQLCDKGITVVRLSDGKEFNKSNLSRDLATIIDVVLSFGRSSEDNEAKARKLKSAWSGKREKATEAGKPMTARCPAWLSLPVLTLATKYDPRAFTVIEERAEIVRRIFGDTLQGCSPHAIAFALNAELVPTFDDRRQKRQASKWWRSYIIKILSNPAVMGTLVPHTLDKSSGKRVRAAQKAIPDYYPAIVDPVTYQRVQALRVKWSEQPKQENDKKRLRGSAAGTVSPIRGKHAKRTEEGKLVSEVQNIFGGRLARCVRCGGALVRVNKSRKGETYNYLVCAAAKSGPALCVYETVRYHPVENAFLGAIESLIDRAPVGRKNPKLDRAIKDTEAQLDGTTDAIGLALESLIRTKSVSMEQKLRALEEERDELKRLLVELETQRANEAGPLIQSRLDALLTTAKEEPRRSDWRTRLNALLRQNLASVTVDSANGLLLIEWAQGGTAEVVYDEKTAYSITPQEGFDIKKRQREHSANRRGNMKGR